jgi:hypothetical protein
MLTPTNKLRMLVALGAVGAALASSGVASAATNVRSPGTVTPTRVVAPPTVVAQTIDPDNVGSAGIAGYDDQKCEDLANRHNDLEWSGYQSLRAGDTKGYNDALDAADDLEDEISDNCIVVD